MKAFKYVFALILVLGLAVPAAGEVPDDVPDFGTLYGDLYVILRDEDGVPILHDYTMLDEYGKEYLVSCVQPISSVTDSITIQTNDPENPFTLDVEEGEPFALPTYIAAAEPGEEPDVVECELTEEMADWVQAVDFGRLNLGRAPYSVIAHAFDEAINKMNAATDIGIDPAGRLVMDPGLDSEKTIDSPAENLALYIKMMLEGHWITLDPTAIVKYKRPDDVGPPGDEGPSTEDRPVLSDEAILQLFELGYGGLGVVVFDPATGDPVKTGEDLNKDELLLAASLLAAAADKTGSITLDKVVYINSIYGINQIGSWPGSTEGESYFNFGLALGEAEPYVRATHYAGRQSGDCPLGEIWVLQPEIDLTPDETGQVHYVTTCMDILGHEPDAAPYQANAVHFDHMSEVYDTVEPDYEVFDSNVRGFVQASDDSLQVLEYIHNYKTPEDLYGVYTP